MLDLAGPSTTRGTPLGAWRRAQASSLALVLLLAAPAASLAEPAKPDASAPPTAASEARDIYASTCVSCHGPGGAGDGLAAVGLPAKPASFADPAWQARTSDAEIERAIVGGGAAVGKSPLMPASPSLAGKPEVVAALRSLIRSFGAAAKR
jgi:mono/diheme cytochrome c family protein